MEKNMLRMGMAATPWWIVTLLLIGSLQPNYSHLYKAVSELGALDAQNPFTMNILCLFFTGALGVFGGVALRSFFLSNDVSTWSAWWIIVYGAMLSGTAVPADLNLHFKNPLTIIHAFFALFGVVPFLVAAWKVPRGLAKLNLKSKVITYFPWLIIPTFFMHGVVEQGGLVQRLSILITLVWVGYVFWFVSKSRYV
jgi:hypothetical membrane protein